MIRVAYLMALVLVVNLNAYDPPKNLKWGMTYDEVTTTLKNLQKDDMIKIDKLKTDGNIPDNFYLAALKGVKLFDKKAKEAYAVFDSSKSLCAIQYGFVWNNDENTTNMFESRGKGRANAWEYHQDLTKKLTVKYGPPSKDETEGSFGQPLASGVRLETSWIDSTSGDKIIAAITRQKVNAVISRIDNYIVALVYANRIYINAKETEIKNDGDL